MRQRGAGWSWRRFVDAPHFPGQRAMSAQSGTAGGRGSLFQFMGLPCSPVLEVPALQKRYHEIQWKFHPDQQQVLQKQQQQHQQQLSSSTQQDVPTNQSPLPSHSHDNLEDSVYANIAYETLKDPFLRCKYMLKLLLSEHRVCRPLTAAEAELVHLDDNDEFLLKGKDASVSGGEGPARPPESDAAEAQRRLLARYEPPADFLMEMMELNELVFEAEPSEPDGAKKLTDALEAVKTRDVQYFEEVVAAWEAGDVLRLKHKVLEWTYIANLKKQIINKLPWAFSRLLRKQITKAHLVQQPSS